MPGRKRRLGHNTQPEDRGHQLGGTQVSVSGERHGSPPWSCWHYRWARTGSRPGDVRPLRASSCWAADRSRSPSSPSGVSGACRPSTSPDPGRSDFCAGRDGGGARPAPRVGPGSGAVGCRLSRRTGRAASVPPREGGWPAPDWIPSRGPDVANTGPQRGCGCGSGCGCPARRSPCIPKLVVTWERDAGSGPVPHGGNMERRPGTAALPAWPTRFPIGNMGLAMG